MANALETAGLSKEFVQLYLEMTRAINDGKLQPVNDRGAEDTTPTRFENFAEEFAVAYNAA